jgi:hypothetical protein
MLSRKVIIGIAVLAGLLSTLAIAAPAQAAPNVVAREQVNSVMTNRSTVRYTYWNDIKFELRAGYYQGYQYGWARIAPESYWNPNDIIGLEINDHGNGWELTHLTINDGSGWENTAAQITQASTGYQFRAALYRGGHRVDHTDPW